MHPDPSIAIGRAYQREMIRRAEVGRRAAEFKTAKHQHVQLAIPRVKLGRRIAAVRMRVAQA